MSSSDYLRARLQQLKKRINKKIVEVKASAIFNLKKSVEQIRKIFFDGFS
jgi:hypothetical protein